MSFPSIWGRFNPIVTETDKVNLCCGFYCDNFFSRIYIVGLEHFSSMSTGWGDWAIFCRAGSGRFGRVWSAWKNSLEILCHSWELNPGFREDSQWDIFILPLSYHNPGHEEDSLSDSFILPLSNHAPGHEEDSLSDSFIFPLSYHDW